MLVETINGGEKSVNLDELQRETKQLLALLEDRQIGMLSWHIFMRERLSYLHHLTSKALGKKV